MSAEIERLQERFLRHTTRSRSGCLLWTGATGPKGYGYFAPHRRNRMAHRVSYELFIGPIPDGYQIDHLCRVTGCVEPRHLEAVTPAENNARSNSPTALNARKVECPQGHPYDEANTYRDRRGRRSCKACKQARNAAWLRGYRQRQDSLSRAGTTSVASGAAGDVTGAQIGAQDDGGKA